MESDAPTPNEPVILVVDDDPASLQLSEQILTGAGYHDLRLFDRASAVLDQVDLGAVDLVIVDLHMPGIDGLELLRTIRDKVPAEDFLPVLVVTADATTRAKREALAVGADEFLTKPIDVVEMTLRVRHLLRMRTLHMALAHSHERLASEVEARTAELHAAMERLESLIQAKDVFIASVSHELRTPLTAILGFATELADGAHDLDRSDVTSSARIIADQAADLSAIIDDLLVAARSEINAVEVLSEPVHVTDELGTVVAALREADRSRIEQPAGGLTVQGDRLRVRQILRNLLLNALRHGGSRVRVELGRQDGVGTITVIDDGPGLTAELRERLFEPYVHGRGDGGQPPSIGLGLTVSRFLARLMGGELDLDPRNEGAAFRLTLPAV